MLLGVTGVGPRLAMVILSGISPEGFTTSNAHGGSSQVHLYPGHWQEKKLAERFVLELKDKIAEDPV